MFRLSLRVVMDMQDLVRLAGCEYLFVRAVFPIHMAGDLGTMRDLVTLASNDAVTAHAIGLLVGFIGRDDTIVLVDNDEGVILGVDQGLHLN